MAYKIILHQEAKSDTEKAYNYYENEREGLGEEFLEELVKQYSALSDHPHHYSYIDDRQLLRDLKVERFPYVIVFEITGDEVIVYAVHNT